MSFTVVLEGGSPWGFRLEGGSDFNQTIRIAKVSPLRTCVECLKLSCNVSVATRRSDGSVVLTVPLEENANVLA